MFLHVLYKSNNRRHTHTHTHTHTPWNYKATAEALQEIRLLEVTGNLVRHIR
jgi:hypothetical protein